MVKRFHVFCGLLHNQESVFMNTINVNIMKPRKAGSRERFFGNEGKDMKHQNFFIANIKQYMIRGYHHTNMQ